MASAASTLPNQILTNKPQKVFSFPKANKVFKCPSCNTNFNNHHHVPLTLPCGHVLCKKCLSKSSETILCPLDKQKFNIKISSLPKCQTILQYLPISLDPITNPSPLFKEFICKYHPNKSVKYICEFDNEILCSICLSSHTKLSHKINSFIPNKSAIRSEVEIISKHFSTKNKHFQDDHDMLTKYITSWKQKTNDEINKLNTTINGYIDTLTQIKHLYEEKIKNIYKYQLEEINECRSFIEEQCKNISTIKESISEFNTQYLKENESYSIIFQDFVDSKNNIIQAYEQYKKKSSIKTLSLNNIISKGITLPRIMFQEVFKISDGNFVRLKNEEYWIQKKEESELYNYSILRAKTVSTDEATIGNGNYSNKNTNNWERHYSYCKNKSKNDSVILGGYDCKKRDRFNSMENNNSKCINDNL